MKSRVTSTATAIAVAVVVAATSLNGLPLAVLQKRLSSMGKKPYSFTGAVDRVFKGSNSGLDAWIAAAVAVVVFGAFVTALYGAWRVLTGQRDGVSMWVSSVAGLVLIVALTGFVL